jgi:cytochrome c5
MIRKWIVVAAGGVIICMVAAVVSARPVQRLDPASQTCRVFTRATIEEGRRLFHSVCKSCHSRDNTVEAPFLHSESKTSRAWNRVFAKRFPACAKDGSWATLNDEQLRRVNDFLFMNSADSYDPNSGKDCG